MPTRRRYKKAQIAEALRKAAGLRYMAAQMLGCCNQTVTNYITRYPDLERVIEEAGASALDLAEAELLKKIRAGNLTAIIFFLKTKGRARGYVERREITGADAGPIQLEELEKAADELTRRLFAEIPGDGQSSTRRPN